MSKLAHSNDETMRIIEERARDESIPRAVRCRRCKQEMDSPDEADGCRDPDCPMQRGEA